MHFLIRGFAEPSETTVSTPVMDTRRGRPLHSVFGSHRIWLLLCLPLTSTILYAVNCEFPAPGTTDRLHAVVLTRHAAGCVEEGNLKTAEKLSLHAITVLRNSPVGGNLDLARALNLLGII